ncbi:MAG: FAD-dependent oxidoreductase [Deltaproteobacteria bacterium]|nr:FAD-dependent oxidoreductase [Deltaproteobacteria bacterium]
MTPLACDVLVAGAGPAGLAASLAAARAGARVVLLERQGVLGGLATAGRVGTVCGLYLRDASEARAAPAAGAFPREFAERLAWASGTVPLRLAEGLRVLPYAPAAFEQVADALLCEAPGGVEPILHATLSGVQVERGRVEEVRVLAWGDELTVRPACVVDATGEATVCALAGGPTHDGLGEQAPALVFDVEGVVLPEAGLLPALLCLRRAVQEGTLPAGCEHLSAVPGSSGRPLTLKLALSPAPPGALPWRQITAWEREGRRNVQRILPFLADAAEGFRGARLAGAAAQVGVRSGRRAWGRAILTDADVASGRAQPDGIARGSWPMERWTGGPRPSLTFLPECATYEVPLGCLRPPGLDNLFVAGRAVSAEPGAAASVRVIGTALATGWAAGVLAAHGVGGSAPESAVAQIRRNLDE